MLAGCVGIDDFGVKKSKIFDFFCKNFWSAKMIKSDEKMVFGAFSSFFEAFLTISQGFGRGV